MYKVTVYYNANFDRFKTEMPVIPTKDDKLIFWVNGKVEVLDIASIRHEFDEDNKYVGVEIICKYDE